MEIDAELLYISYNIIYGNMKELELKLLWKQPHKKHNIIKIYKINFCLGKDLFLLEGGVGVTKFPINDGLLH